MFENYKDCIFHDKTILKKKHRIFKSDYHDDKRLQKFDKIAT